MKVYLLIMLVMFAIFKSGCSTGKAERERAYYAKLERINANHAFELERFDVNNTEVFSQMTTKAEYLKISSEHCPNRSIYYSQSDKDLIYVGYPPEDRRLPVDFALCQIAWLQEFQRRLVEKYANNEQAWDFYLECEKRVGFPCDTAQLKEKAHRIIYKNIHLRAAHKAELAAAKNAYVQDEQRRGQNNEALRAMVQAFSQGMNNSSSVPNNYHNTKLSSQGTQYTEDNNSARTTSYTSRGSGSSFNCGIKPIPNIGCRIGRCLDTGWEQICDTSPTISCGIRPIPKVGCSIGRCIDGAWEQVCTQLSCGIKPIPKIGCRIGRCVDGAWEQICG